MIIISSNNDTNINLQKTETNNNIISNYNESIINVIDINNDTKYRY